MNVKRFIGKDANEAIEKVKLELGRDAFILNTRKIRRGGFLGFLRKPLVEVVAAYEKPEVRQPVAAGAGVTTVTAAPAQVMPQSAAVPPAAEPAATGFVPYFPVAQKQERVITPVTTDSNEKYSDLEDKIESLTNQLTSLMTKMQTGRAEPRGGYSPQVERMLLSLLDNEVHEEFANKIAREVEEIIARKGEDPSEVMEQILKQYLGEAAPIKLRKFKRTIAVMVGPTGVGKTTSLAKLAAIYSINHHAKVGLITTDTYRIAAVEQLKTYAEILELPLSVVYNLDELPDALREHDDKDLVFIDTAGKSPNDKTLEEEISALVKISDASEVHLVMSATTSFTGCLNVVNTYSFLRDYKVLMTKMDETPTWGMLLNLRILSDRAFSYMAAGQTVPDDIETANNRKIIARLLGKE